MRSAYRIMWMFVFFDLPTLTKDQRKTHSKFRKIVQKLGFSRAQLSVYIAHFASEEAKLSTRRKLKESLPEQGNVRILLVTDRQFGKMEVFSSKLKTEVEKPLPQVLLF